MKQIFNLIILLIFTTEISAQSEKETYQFSIDIEVIIEKDTLSWKYQLVSGNFTETP